LKKDPKAPNGGSTSGANKIQQTAPARGEKKKKGRGKGTGRFLERKLGKRQGWFDQIEMTLLSHTPERKKLQKGGGKRTTDN